MNYCTILINASVSARFLNYISQNFPTFRCISKVGKRGKKLLLTFQCDSERPLRIAEAYFNAFEVA